MALKTSPSAEFSQDRDLRYTWSYNSQSSLPGSEKLGKTAGELFDPEEAARTTGDATARLNLGLAYDLGKGVPKDEVEAVRWYRRAADQGDADAQFNLGLAYDQELT